MLEYKTWNMTSSHKHTVYSNGKKKVCSLSVQTFYISRNNKQLFIYYQILGKYITEMNSNT